MPRLLRKLGRIVFGGSDLKNWFFKTNFLNHCLQKNLLRDAEGGEQGKSIDQYQDKEN